MAGGRPSYRMLRDPDEQRGSAAGATHSPSAPLAGRQMDGDYELGGPFPAADTDELLRPQFRFSWRKFVRFLGPGWLMSLAYLDPGNLESDIQQGAYSGFSLVWVLFWATAMGLVLQETSARLGLVTGLDLAQLVSHEYPLWLNWTIYAMMELAVISSDIQEVVGSAIAISLLSNGRIPLWAGCVLTGLDTFTFLSLLSNAGDGSGSVSKRRALEALVGGLIAIMCICFFVNWNESHTDFPALLRGWLIPSCQTYAVTQAVGTIGAVVMPHNLYLHSGLVQGRVEKLQADHHSEDAAAEAAAAAAEVAPRSQGGGVESGVGSGVGSGARSDARIGGSDVGSGEGGRSRKPPPAQRSRSCSRNVALREVLVYSCLESTVALGFSFVINLGIVATNADNFFSTVCAEAPGGPLACMPEEACAVLTKEQMAERAQIECPLRDGEGGLGLCCEIGLETEGAALGKALGPAALYIWAVGLLAAGQASTMTCTYAGQIIMAGCVQVRIPPWLRLAMTRVLALAPAIFIAASTVENMALLNEVNEYINVFQSLQLPFAMLPVLHFAASKRIMGRFRSNAALLTASVVMAFIVIFVNAILVMQFFAIKLSDYSALLAIYSVCYLCVCAAMVWDDLKELGRMGARLCGCRGRREHLDQSTGGTDLRASLLS